MYMEYLEVAEELWQQHGFFNPQCSHVGQILPLKLEEELHCVCERGGKQLYFWNPLKKDTRICLQKTILPIIVKEDIAIALKKKTCLHDLPIGEEVKHYILPLIKPLYNMGEHIYKCALLGD